MNKTLLLKTDSEVEDLQLSKGQVSRAMILHVAAKLATTRGLNGLSIGDLATAVGMSKSGLYAHFKSKQELALATIESAVIIFSQEVIQPGKQVQAGTARLKALADLYLSYLERKVFPGGCFFATVSLELATHPGPTLDRVIKVVDAWLLLLKECVIDGQASGQIDPSAVVEQAVYEIEAMLLAANFLFVMTNDPIKLLQARAGVENVLARLAISDLESA
jgi:AcrR family transcriptional regulator